MLYFFFFFFQAEDGIRDLYVTGVQTCALPISATFASGNVSVSRDRNDWNPADRSLSSTANDSGEIETRPARSAPMSVPSDASDSGMISSGSPNRYSQRTSPSRAHSGTAARG